MHELSNLLGCSLPISAEAGSSILERCNHETQKYNYLKDQIPSDNISLIAKSTYVDINAWLVSFGFRGEY